MVGDPGLIGNSSMPRQLATIRSKSATPMPQSSKAALIYLQGTAGTEYWIVLQNFYSITRYNRSKLYAMAAGVYRWKPCQS